MVPHSSFHSEKVLQRVEMEETAERLENLVNKCKDLNVSLECLSVPEVYRKLYTRRTNEWNTPKWTPILIAIIIGLYFLKHYNLSDEVGFLIRKEKSSPPSFF